MKSIIHFILTGAGLIYERFDPIDFYLLGATLSILALILIGIIITVFVLTVTLLGRAAKLTKEKRAETEQKSKQEFDKDIANLNQKLKEDPEDIQGLKKQIGDLETKKTYNENQLKELERKYSALGLKKSVLVPGGLFLASLFFGKWVILVNQNQIWQFASFCLSLIFLLYGIQKIILSLQAVSEVSLNADDYQSDQLQNALTQALKTIESEKEPRPSVIFKEKPPFIFTTNAEAKIDFEIDLILPGNKEARNVDVWFLSSREIELLEDPAYGKPFKQKNSFDIPNANTIRYKFDIVRKHTRTSGLVKIKTTVAGNFKLRYKVDCDNHVESVSADREAGIIVQD